MSYFLTILTFVLTCSAQPMHALQLKGANGTMVDFAGLLEARPTGLVASVKAGDEPQTYDWELFDREYLKLNEERIFQAYRAAVTEGQHTYLKLGIFEGVLTYEETIRDLRAILGKQRNIYIPKAFYALVNDIPKFRDQSRDDLDKFERYYNEFLNDLFQGQHGGSYYPGWGSSRVVYNTNLNAPTFNILGFLATSDSQSVRVGIYYFQKYPYAIKDIIKELKSVSEQIPNPSYVDSNELLFTRFLERAIIGLESILEHKTLSHDGQRDIERLLDTVIP